MYTHLRLNNVSDITSTIPTPPSQTGQDVYMTHKENICRNSMYIGDVIKTASPADPLFTHLYIPHFRPTPFGPFSPKLLHSWCFWTSFFSYPPSLPRVMLLKRSFLTVSEFWCLSFDETCGMKFWRLKPTWTREKSSKNQELEAFDLANECEREREVFKMRVEGDGYRYAIHIFSLSRARVWHSRLWH